MLCFLGEQMGGAIAYSMRSAETTLARSADAPADYTGVSSRSDRCFSVEE